MADQVANQVAAINEDAANEDAANEDAADDQNR